MKLTKQSIINQLCHELLAWKALNLRPEAILGTRDPSSAFKLYSKLLGEASLINTGVVLEQLQAYAILRSAKGEFLQHFGVHDPRVVNPSLPPLIPYFCATSLFREAIAQNTISLEYDDVAQAELINNNLRFAYPSAATHLNGVKIAAETGNEEMVSFLLHPSLPMFNLTDEYQHLLDNTLVTHPPVRQAIFRACGERFVPAMMDELILRMRTVDEWIALYQALSSAERQLLLNGSTAAIWTRLNPNEAQIQTILSLIPPQASAQLYTTLLFIASSITDGPLILRLMDRMKQADRPLFVLRLGERVNTLFSAPADLQTCLTLLGYSIDAASGRLKLNHIHPADEPVVAVVHSLNQAIWDSTLDIHMKLGYFHVTQQLLLANPGGRQACIQAYEDCIKQCESMLRDQADTGLNWFWRVLNAVGRFFGFISDFPVTLQAQNLLSLVNNAVAVNPLFHAVILDLSRVILPDEPPESQRRKDAIGALTSSDNARYVRFWSTMTPAERASLLSDQSRFQQLLEMFSDDASIEQLMLGLSENMRDELLDIYHTAALLSLLQMPRVSMPKLLDCLGENRKNHVLIDPVWFGEMMSQLPEPIVQQFLGLIDTAILASTQNNLLHLQSALVKADLNRFAFLGQYFAPSIPLNKTPQQIGGLIESMSIEKLLPFWTTFLPGRVITVAEMAQLLPVITTAEKKRALITHQMAASPITVWSDELFILLPDMTPAQQAHTLSVMTDDDLRRLNREGRIEDMISKLTPGNDLALLDRYRTVFSEPVELNHFLDQLLPPRLELLLSKPSFEFLRLLDGHNLLRLIRALKCRSDAQWDVFLPKLLGMAEGIYGRADPVVALLQQHVPAGDHDHVLNLLRTASDDELRCLFEKYLDTVIVQALMLHKKLDFNAITLYGIREIMVSGSNADDKPQLIALSDTLFHDLIKSHLVKLMDQVIALEGSMATPKTGLLALMVPKPGTMWGYSFSSAVIADITQKWANIVPEIQQLTQHNAELVRFCSIRHYDEAMVALKPIHERISNLVTHVVDPFIAQNKDSITRTNLKVTYSVANTKAIEALEQVEVTLQDMESDAEARLLDAFSDEDIIHKMKTGDQLKDLFALIVVTPNNKGRCLERCRTLLVTQHLWQELSPSSLTLLSKDAPKALFGKVSRGDFMTLVRAFSHLTLDQWNALAPNLLTLRTQHFNQGDALVSLLQEDVRTPAHLHVLNLIRTASDEEQVERLLNYLTSDVVREYKKHNPTDDATITIAALPELDSAAESWLVADVREKEAVLLQVVNGLGSEIDNLQRELNPDKQDLGLLSRMFYDKYIFNYSLINQKFTALAQALHAINVQKDVLSDLYVIKLDAGNVNFMPELDAKLTAMVRQLTTFMELEASIEKLSYASKCHYRNEKNISAKDCLTKLCRELTILAGGEDELAMEATLSGSAAAQSGAFMSG